MQFVHPLLVLGDLADYCPLISSAVDHSSRPSPAGSYATREETWTFVLVKLQEIVVCESYHLLQGTFQNPHSPTVTCNAEQGKMNAVRSVLPVQKGVDLSLHHQGTIME
ncbi:hypothetical protein CC1G_15444 [Coprinopsis cinerea okayama7|uniref:Uncharacterized protein n=1 Tax=Coprinopsis cinerea (strain Okayama-7 / 130 / ATCC MYA-4618 / FGSC 9003) TaxID=240176 RepID=D6RQU6_COPC7|nr:hypothetical protein CC1G_15444 [Coprinopsis cinerea okayama7\|eukprot:XP_002910167.1 hypothetical protein CC1G_15444 [Coprinopsis cinerea okayama7\